MSEFDILNGKLDMILSRLGYNAPIPPAPQPPPPPPIGTPEAPLPPPGLPQAGPFPSVYVRGRVVCNLYAGAAYRCYFPEAGGYMISVEQGRGGRLLAWQEGTPQPGWDQGVVDAATIMAQAQTAWLVMAEKDCTVNMDG